MVAWLHSLATICTPPLRLSSFTHMKRPTHPLRSQQTKRSGLRARHLAGFLPSAQHKITGECAHTIENLEVYGALPIHLPDNPAQ